jgi:hypothetical protein
MIKQFGAAAVLGNGPVDVGLLHRAATLRSVYQAVSRARGLIGEDIHTLSDGDRETLAWLRREGLL